MGKLFPKIDPKNSPDQIEQELKKELDGNHTSKKRKKEIHEMLEKNKKYAELERDWTDKLAAENKTIAEMNANNNAVRAIERMKDAVNGYGENLPMDVKSIEAQNRRDLNSNMESWDRVVSAMNHAREVLPEEMKKQVDSVVELHQKQKKYLWDLDTKCMDFMDWHEFEAGKVKKGNC